jgi:cobalt-precorrin 5A hydrolase
MPTLGYLSITSVFMNRNKRGFQGLSLIRSNLNPTKPQVISIVAITRNGIRLARTIKSKWPEAKVYVPSKHYDSSADIQWFDEPTSQVMENLFKASGALVCIFSLGAVIRLVAPHVTNKKYDPAVIVIDDKANFVISALSGHLGGANSLAAELSSFLEGSTAVITTAADVNQTIAVDILGRELGWVIDNYDRVTQVSACMVNEEPVGVYQDTGEKNWWAKKELPKNVKSVIELSDLKSAQLHAGLIITDRILGDNEISSKSVIYRPKSLVVGIGIHWNTKEETIESAINQVFGENYLSTKSIRNLATIDNKGHAKGLLDFSAKYKIPVETYSNELLSRIPVPNPSEVVGQFEGTTSVSEAASLLSSKGKLVIPKIKFPPDLTLSIARVGYA